MTDRYALPHPARPRDVFRDLAAGICLLEGMALLGFTVFYLWELARHGGDDATRVVMSALLIAVFAVAMGVLARSWWSGANWPNTPTVVWNVLLLPVALSLAQGGRTIVGVLVAVVAVVAVVAAVRADTADTADDGGAGGAPDVSSGS